ncbi:hypothetical protein B0H11DRAFT_2266844 [Mycena galericulata]|nr:hypothetical protein B0H11DRAFT_2266844 [Mycena galericulata]
MATPNDPRIAHILNSPPSPSDGPGYLYVFRIFRKQPLRRFGRAPRSRRAKIKIGRTNNPQRRRREWARQCRGQRVKWWFWWYVPFAKQFERLIHTHFRIHGAWIHPSPCGFCWIRHQEIFDHARCGGKRGVSEVVEEYLGILRWPSLKTTVGYPGDFAWGLVQHLKLAYRTRRITVGGGVRRIGESGIRELAVGGGSPRNARAGQHESLPSISPRHACPHAAPSRLLRNPDTLPPASTPRPTSPQARTHPGPTCCPHPISPHPRALPPSSTPPPPHFLATRAPHFSAPRVVGVIVKGPLLCTLRVVGAGGGSLSLLWNTTDARLAVGDVRSGV